MTDSVNIGAICKKEWLNEKEAESYTGINGKTLRKFRETGSKKGVMLPYARIGRKIIRYRRKDIDDFFLKHKPEKLEMI